MSHFTLLAIGFKDEAELYTAMAPYDESKVGPPRVDMTKEEILETGRKIYANRCDIIKKYEKDPDAAIKKYGKFAEEVYSNKDDPEKYYNISDPEEFYKNYTDGCPIDENGNLMTTYNELSKWDHYSIDEKTTIGKLKKLKEKYLKNFDPSNFERIWDIIVNGAKAEIDNFMILYGQPSKDEMLRMYQTKENYVKHMKQYPTLSYCVLTETGWHAPGKVGMFAISTATPEAEKNFRENYFKKFIEPYDDDTPVMMIDCHI